MKDAFEGFAYMVGACAIGGALAIILIASITVIADHNKPVRCIRPDTQPAVAV